MLQSQQIVGVCLWADEGSFHVTALWFDEGVFQVDRRVKILGFRCHTMILSLADKTKSMRWISIATGLILFMKEVSLPLGQTLK